MLPGIVDRLLGRGLGVARADADRIIAELRAAGLVADDEAAAIRDAVERGIAGTRDALAGGPTPPDAVQALVERLDRLEARLAAVERALRDGGPRS
jgi:hypothetical protein